MLSWALVHGAGGCFPKSQADPGFSCSLLAPPSLPTSLLSSILQTPSEHFPCSGLCAGDTEAAKGTRTTRCPTCEWAEVLKCASHCCPALLPLFQTTVEFYSNGHY